MANGEGTSAGNRQINANTTVTVGLVVAIIAASSWTIYKAGEVIAGFDYVKRDVMELRADMAEVKRMLQGMNRQQGGPVYK